jgi:Tfp pilus assembly protein PilN
MINLLPSQTRENIMYARRNTALLHWTTALMAGIAGIVIVVVFGHIFINENTKNINQQVEQAKAELQDQKLDETQKRVEDLSGSLKLVNQVLSKQILFSELLKQTGAVMPSGATLSSLTVSKLQGGIDLQVVSKDYQTATQVQVNLADKNNKIFDKVDIVSITCSTGAQAITAYPCSGNYRALFAKDNPFSVVKTSGGSR